jgi:hypothetical protein
MLVERYNGGAKWMGVAGIVGVLGLIATFIGFLTPARQDAYYSYLFSFAYFFAISVGGLLFLMALYATNSKWPTVIRRPVEAVAGAIPILAILFIPIFLSVLLGLDVLYPWTKPQANFTPLEQHHFHGAKETYLSVPFFVVRQIIYFGVMIFVSTALIRWSKRVDVDGGYEHIAQLRRFSSGAIPFVGLALSWAAFDWLMSLTPFWQSTIFGVYYFAGGFLSAIAVVTLACVWTRGNRHLFGYWITSQHQHNLGKLLLAFTAFWAYIGFSQLMLIWIANLPEEVPYFWVRLKTDWRPVTLFLVVGHFALPFALLLPRTTKLIPQYLAVVSVWLLFACAVDVYWMVMPALHPEGPRFSIFNLTAFVGVGGIATAFALWRVRGRYMIPVRDPYLEDSLRYAQP